MTGPSKQTTPPASRQPLVLLVTAALALAGCPDDDQPLPANLDERARAFVQLLVDEEFDRAVEVFDATMRGALPAPKLEAVWKSVLDRAGGFEKIRSTRRQRHEQYVIVYVTCGFEQGPFDVKVVFDPEGRVAGLYFSPAKREVVYTPPEYVDRKAFREVDVTVGDDPWKLDGTLSLPKEKGPHPGLVLVHGSGPQDRDETIGGARPFRDLAWGLASRGVAVLRYEKRTRQHASRMGMFLHTITTREETTDDALHAVAALRRAEGVDPERVYVLGHSLGGMLSPRIGKSDPTLAGLIVLAGTARPLENVVLDQFGYLFGLDGEISKAERERLTELRTKIRRVKRMHVEKSAGDTPAPDELPLGLPASYWRDLHGYHPPALARTLAMPVLVLQGGRDYQVTEKDFQAWKQGLAGKKNATFRHYPELNHLFAPGEGKSTPAEYERTSHVARQVIENIAGWIHRQRGG